jgi:hypothetical protein
MTTQTLTPAALRHVENEIPVGLVDGVNMVYQTQNVFYAGTLTVYLNGIKLLPGIGRDYEILPNNQGFVMNYAPLVGDIVDVSYFRQS